MGYRFLIVDDSAVTRSLIRRSLQLSGFTTEAPLEAQNGVRALSLLAEYPVDLVLADLHMPEMTGEDLINYMQRNPETARIPVVIVSAEPSVTRIEALCAAGAKGYLRKPFTPESLRDMLTPLLEARHATA